MKHCIDCRHYIPRYRAKDGGSTHSPDDGLCNLDESVPRLRRMVGGRLAARDLCLNARDDGSACGPDAALFEP